MNAVEIAVFILLALAVGTLVVMFVADIDYNALYEELRQMFMKDKSVQFKSVDMPGFFEELLLFWKQYQFSDSKGAMTVYIQEAGYLDKKKFFETVKENNLCMTLQSAGFDCGSREDLRLEHIDLPMVVRVVYENDTLFINSMEEFPSNLRSINVLFVPFSGFEGDGRIRKELGFLPGDARILEFTLDLFAGTDFDLYVNDGFCGTFQTVVGHNNWSVECDRLGSGQDNWIELRFLSKDLFRHYVAGGYAQVVYDTISVQNPVQAISLPQINGTIKYFGQVVIPGTPVSMQIQLHYWLGDLLNKDLYVNVGDMTVFRDSVSNRENFAQVNVPLQLLKEGATLLRIGIDSQADWNKQISVPIPVDVVLITDQSGSMDCDLDNIEPQSCESRGDLGDRRGDSCTHPLLLNDQTQKLILAKCFGREFSRIILDTFENNRIGLVSFANNVNGAAALNLTNELRRIEDKLMEYDADGGTCVSCAIDLSREMLQESSRFKAMVIMTDGVANHCLGGSSCGEEAAAEEAYQQALIAHETYNISIFTIAFGLNDPTGIDLLQRIACIDNCSNFGYGNTPEDIQRIYRDFAEMIATRFAVLTKRVQGYHHQNVTPSVLFSDSQIILDYVPAQAAGGSIKLLVHKRLDCPDLFDLPYTLVVEEASILSSAGVYWTDFVEVNNQAVLDFSAYSGASYGALGDPFCIPIPSSVLGEHNSVSIAMGDIGESRFACAENSTLRYIAALPQQPASFRNALGCHWTVESFSNLSFTIPPSYFGDRKCLYTRASQRFSSDDIYQYAAGQLFRGLDFDGDGAIDDSIESVHVIGGLT
ncbi:MAG: vWA domain-containing protein [Candidatus Woesearchaeota archaeon]